MGVGVEYPQFEAVGEIVGCRVDADRTAECAETGFDSGNPRGDIGMVWPRARRNLARHPHTSTVADMTSEPISPIAPRDIRPCGEFAFHADLRAPASVRPPWHREDHRADCEDLGKRRA